jgi:hypothetical protein
LELEHVLVVVTTLLILAGVATWVLVARSRVPAMVRIIQNTEAEQADRQLRAACEYDQQAMESDPACAKFRNNQPTQVVPVRR